MNARRGAPAVVRFRVSPTATVRSTEVVVGSGVLGRLEALLDDLVPSGAPRLVAVDAGVAPVRIHGRWAGEWRPEPGTTIEVPAGEAAKTRAVHARIEDAILAHGIGRDGVVIAVGGGAVLDVVGFAAATVGRGVPWVAVPTSVVGQVDAGLGGKTAINHRRGKNLLGAFHPPLLLVADPTTLRTLPARDRIAGLAEVYKSGVVGDEQLLRLLARRGGVTDDAWWLDVVARALAVKARLVTADERDTGPRRLLNYGHTVGHALETTLGNAAVRHGEAIAIGMGVAAQIARGRGLVDASFVDGQDAALERLGLPTRVPAAVAVGRLLLRIASDKKRRAGARHAFVLPRRAGPPQVVEDVTDVEVEEALRLRQDRRRGSRGTR